MFPRARSHFSLNFKPVESFACFFSATTMCLDGVSIRIESFVRGTRALRGASGVHRVHFSFRGEISSACTNDSSSISVIHLKFHTVVSPGVSRGERAVLLAFLVKNVTYDNNNVALDLTEGRCTTRLVAWKPFVSQRDTVFMMRARCSRTQLKIWNSAWIGEKWKKTMHGMLRNKREFVRGIVSKKQFPLFFARRLKFLYFKAVVLNLFEDREHFCLLWKICRIMFQN